MTVMPNNPPLSHDAQALLLELRMQRGRLGVGVPVTDRALAGKIGVSLRSVIDLAAELIHAGHLVCASCKSDAPGRFLLIGSEGDDLAPANEYERVLEDRAVAIFDRRKDFRAALESAERQRNPDSRGQLSLGLEVTSHGE